MALADEEIFEILMNDDTSIIGSDSEDGYENELANMEDLEQYVIEEEVNTGEEISTCKDENVLELQEDFARNNELTKKTNIKWRTNVTFISPSIDWYFQEPLATVSLPSPNEIFAKYFTNKLFTLAADMTNKYATYKNISRFQSTNMSEMKKLFALHIVMGNLNYPRARMYWDSRMGIPMVKDNMPFNRFSKLRNALHVADISSERTGNDRLWKVRPVYDQLKKVCNALPLECNLCIDEQIVPFKGQLNIKQYIKNKPNKWGVKIYFLNGQSGKIYDFIIYQGSTTEVNDKYKMLGITSATVLHLSERIGVNHRLFFDNYFNSYHLLQCLHNKQIYAIGTARLNRFFSPPLLSEKKLKQNGRGSCDNVVSADGQVILTTWYDNKSIVMASNYMGIGNTDLCKRWDKKNKKHIWVPRPECISLYNSNMGGVDKLNFLASLYRSYVRSRKWTIRMITHALDLALINSWLEYKEKAAELGVRQNKILDLLHFRHHVAEGLILSPMSKPKGRPSVSSELTPGPSRICEIRPQNEVRFDGYDHYAKYDDKTERSRCKMEGCSQKTYVYCCKCKVHLCFLKNRNCFYFYHNK